MSETTLVNPKQHKKDFEDELTFTANISKPIIKWDKFRSNFTKTMKDININMVYIEYDNTDGYIKNINAFSKNKIIIINESIKTVIELAFRLYRHTSYYSTDILDVYNDCIHMLKNKKNLNNEIVYEYIFAMA
jgi:hypothetical protein